MGCWCAGRLSCALCCCDVLKTETKHLSDMLIQIGAIDRADAECGDDSGLVCLQDQLSANAGIRSSMTEGGEHAVGDFVMALWEGDDKCEWLVAQLLAKHANGWEIRWVKDGLFSSQIGEAELRAKPEMCESKEGSAVAEEDVSTEVVEASAEESMREQDRVRNPVFQVDLSDRRKDIFNPGDEQYYTRDEFIGFYGGVDEWNACGVGEVDAAGARIAAYVQKIGPKKSTATDERCFVQSCRIAGAEIASDTLVDLLKGVEVDAHMPIGSGQAKASKYGMMWCAGFGSKGHTLFRPFEGALKLCREVCAAVDEETLDLMFGTGFSRTYKIDDCLLERKGCIAIFVTKNFSHSTRLVDEAEQLVHRDREDQSSTLLVIYQAENTPDVHRVHWYEEGLSKPEPIVGAYGRIFNGRIDMHGLLPPKVS